ncbi:hypothetical protein BASA61_009081 [Batrachochytrium salamandrivorans]|nr:hypothetical protein BASA60_002900 [Batrachochytrium salamandrivorans]KAH6581387.1 hypothetical protein BASA61_009081 [Batrachochytrium salamandrivorans]
MQHPHHHHTHRQHIHWSDHQSQQLRTTTSHSSLARRPPLQQLHQAHPSNRDGLRPLSYHRDPSQLASTPVITRVKSPIPPGPSGGYPASSRTSVGGPLSRTATITGASTKGSSRASSKLSPGVIRHRASLPSLKAKEGLYQQMDDNRKLRESVRASKQQNPATTFQNLSKLMEIEANVVGKPLINGYRIYIREDQAQDTDHTRIRILLFNDMVVCGPYYPPEPDMRHAYVKQTICLFERSFGMQKIGLQGAHLMAGKSSVGLLFPTEVARDDWVNTIYATMDAHRAVLIRRSRRLQTNLPRAGSGSVSGSAVGGGGGSGGGGGGGSGSLAEFSLEPIWTSGLDAAALDHGYYDPDFVQSAKPYCPSTSTGRSSRSTLATTWIPDQEATVCMICQATKFSVFVRKHHCRQCGRVICHKCSQFRNGGRRAAQIRVCLECHDQSLDDYFDATESLFSSP